MSVFKQKDKIFHVVEIFTLLVLCLLDWLRSADPGLGVTVLHVDLVQLVTDLLRRSGQPALLGLLYRVQGDVN